MVVQVKTQGRQALAALQRSSDELNNLQSAALQKSQLDNFHMHGVVHMLEAELNTLQDKLSATQSLPQVTHSSTEVSSIGKC